MYDIIIIGGGPSGATLARLLNKNLKVLLLEKRNLLEAPEEQWSREKCCGGLIAPDAQAMLAKLGLGIPKEVLVGPQLFTVRTMDFDNNLERFYIRNYINVDRQRFDRWILSLLPENVELIENAVFKGYEEKVEGITVQYFKNGKLHEERGKLLVGADGAASILRKAIFMEEKNRYVSIQELYEVDQPSPYFSSFFDREISDFYSWTIPKENYLIVGAAIAETDEVHEKFELLKRKLIEKGFPLGKPIKRSGAYIIRPKNLNQISTGQGRIFLVGEAAGFISPSSAEGVSYGMKSGRMLSEAINETIKVRTGIKDKTQHRIQQEDIILKESDIRKTYSRKAWKLKWDIIRKNLKSPAMYHPFIRGIILRSGILSAEIKA